MAASRNLPFEFVQRWPFLGREFEPDLSDELIEHFDQRDRDLEDFLGSLGDTIRIIDMGDSITLTGYTKSHWIPSSVLLTVVVGVVSVPGTTDLVADVVRDGVSISTVTLPAGDTIIKHNVNEAFPTDSLWQMSIIIQSDALGLTWYGRFE